MPFPYDWPIIWDHEESGSFEIDFNSVNSKRSILSRIKNAYLYYPSYIDRLINSSIIKSSNFKETALYFNDNWYIRSLSKYLSLETKTLKDIFLHFVTSLNIRPALNKTANYVKASAIQISNGIENVISLSKSFISEFNFSGLLNRNININNVIISTVGYFTMYIEESFLHNGLYTYMRNIISTVKVEHNIGRLLFYYRLYTINIISAFLLIKNITKSFKAYKLLSGIKNSISWFSRNMLSNIVTEITLGRSYRKISVYRLVLQNSISKKIGQGKKLSVQFYLLSLREDLAGYWEHPVVYMITRLTVLRNIVVNQLYSIRVSVSPREYKYANIYKRFRIYLLVLSSVISGITDKYLKRILSAVFIR
jgi:hypothetical protein